MSKWFIIFFILFLESLEVKMAFSQTLNPEKYKGREQTITRIRIASAAVVPEKWDKERNWIRIEALVRKAANDGGANVVVTPEGALDGYVINEVNEEKNQLKKAESEARFLELAESIDGLYIEKARQLAKELRIFLVFGFLERAHKTLHNTVILLDTEGDIIGRYRKTHFAQGYEVNPQFYKPGETYPVFDTPFGKVGILICYDRQLPEPARILAVKGAQVLFVPAYGSYTEEDGWNTVLMRTRAYENRCPLVFCNPYQSMLIDRNGGIKAIGNSGEVVYYEVNTSPERYQNRFRNRRPDTYRELCDNRE
ncbi:carbon-nitrogen hydrolase family protein [candidate division KSB1 bacterium]|nr:carbon-nitrogen hydrolase family protein [candidate division KSB1 bacterium]